MKARRIHITGAAGAGITTLGRALADHLAILHHDTDDYFWIPTSPPFLEKRAVADRLNLMDALFVPRSEWVLSGSPPRQTATLSDNVDGPSERDRHIKMIDEHGRMAWQKATNYGRRSLVETAFGRYKSIIGDGLSARDDGAQVAEVAIGIKALNRMIRAAKPISVRA